MDPSQWQRVKQIFDVALERSPEERSFYLRTQCAGDELLQREVEELLAANAGAGDFLGDGWLIPILPVPDEFILRPGDVVSGRFRIIRSVGSGGMGHVYEAHDSTLGVRVALKALRPEIAPHPEVLLRFRQEVRIAHRITHSNVCRTFHLDHEMRQTGPDLNHRVNLTFITMEYLDGETLQQRLRRKGRLPPEEALSIAQQMAAALEAAHRIGVIHRDIKPGNVMICADGTDGTHQERVVITDFGLAKASLREAEEDVTSISTPGTAMGTLSYMAPEQLQGAEVTPATDIYAFGLLLFEMLVGHKAFSDTATPAAALGRLSMPPPSPQKENPQISRGWEAAIIGCLQVDTTARFQSAAEVIATIQEERSVALRRSRVVPRAMIGASHAGLTRRMVAGIVFVCVAMSVFLLGFRLYRSKGNSSVSPGAIVYLAPVANPTGEKKLDELTELLRAGLNQSVQMNLLDAARVGATLQKMTKPADAEITPRIAREVALRNGASRVILPSIARSGAVYTLHIEMQQPDSNGPSRPRAHWENDFSWTNVSPGAESVSPEMIAALRNATDWLRLQLGESRKDVLSLNASPEDVTTSRWDALAAFTQAERLDTAHKKWEAVLSLQNAIRLDPHFALAYARLGDILFSVNRDSEGVAAYRSALDASTERALSRKELDRVQGMYAIDTSDYNTAIQAFRDYAAFYPNDYIGWAYPTAALRALNLDEQAVANLRKAVVLQPDNSFPVLALTDELTATGHIEELSHWVGELRAHGFEAAASQLEVQRRFLVFDFNGAYAELDKLSVSGDLSRRIRSFRTRLRIAAELGDFPRAMQAADNARTESEAQGEIATEALVLEDRASLECQQQQYTACLADLDKAVSLNTGRLVLLGAENIMGPALQAAPPQQAPQFRRRIHQLEQTIDHGDFGFVTRAMRARAHAESLLADHDNARAIEEMRKAATLDAPSGSREYLGRALVAAAKANPSGARALLVEARTAYAAVALRPEATWTDTWNFPPGFLEGEIAAYLHLTAQLGQVGPEPAHALDYYAHLRPQSAEASQEFRRALLRPA